MAVCHRFAAWCRGLWGHPLHKASAAFFTKHLPSSKGWSLLPLICWPTLLRRNSYSELPCQSHLNICSSDNQQLSHMWAAATKMSKVHGKCLSPESLLLLHKSASVCGDGCTNCIYIQEIVYTEQNTGKIRTVPSPRDLKYFSQSWYLAFSRNLVYCLLTSCRI